MSRSLRTSAHGAARSWARGCSLVGRPTQVDRARISSGNLVYNQTFNVRHVSTSASTSSLSSWLPSSSARKAPPRPTVSVEQLLKSIHADDIVSARRAYDELFSAHIAGTKKVGFTDVWTIMMDLSYRRSPRAVRMLKKVYSDLEQWGFDRDPRVDGVLLRGLCSAGRAREAFAFAEQIDADLDGWREVMKSAVMSDLDIVPIVIDRLRAAGMSKEDYGDIFRYLRRLPHEEAMRGMLDILRELKTEGIRLLRPATAELARLQIHLGKLQHAEKTAGQWEMHLVKDVTLWNVYVELAVAMKDVERVRDAMAAMRSKGKQASQLGLSFLLRSAIEEKLEHTPELRQHEIMALVDSLEQEMGAKLDGSSWSEVMDLLVERSGDMGLVMEVYDEARERGVYVHSRLARSVIDPLLKQTPPRLSEALDVYNAFVSRPIHATETKARERTLAIYRTLLGACATSQPSDPSIPLRLLRDMRSNEIQLPTSLLTRLPAALIASAPDHDTAFNYYAHFHAIDPSAFDADAYNQISVAFLALHTPSSSFAPPSYVFEILRDMDAAGYKSSPNILLSRTLKMYGQRATPSRKSSTDPIYLQEKLQRLHRSIGEIHNLINLGSIVVPDVPLLVSLMDAYARVGAYTAAFQVWDQLVERRPREVAADVPMLYASAVSVILDASGRADQYSRAKRIIGWARRFGITSDKITESYVECLCRLGKHDEAADLVCVELREKGKMEEEVKEAVRILLKFSWSDKVAFRTVPERVREAWPGLWEELKGVVETKSTRFVGEEEDQE